MKLPVYLKKISSKSAALVLVCSLLPLNADSLLPINEELSLDGDVFKASPRDKNIGFGIHHVPVPASALCLTPQAISNTLVSLGAAVGPTVAVNPKDDNYIVAAWQQSKINNGGALEIGIAHSDNGGHEWHRTVVPFQDCIRGFIQRVSDCWLSYAPDGRLYLSVLAVNATQDINMINQMGVVVSMSKDNGKKWSNPHWVVASQNYLSESIGAFPLIQKPSVTADINDDTNAYVVWDTLDTALSLHGPTYIARTTDAGKTWLPHQLLYDPSNDPGISTPNTDTSLRQTKDNIIIALPEDGPQGGSLLNFMVRIYPTTNSTTALYNADTVWPYQYKVYDIACVRSTDQGATWQTQATVIATIENGPNGLDPLVFTGGYTYDLSGNVTGGMGVQLRTGDDSPSFAVNPVNGNLYAVWQTSLLSVNYPKGKKYLPQIALSTSRDGGLTWSAPVKVSQTPKDSPNPQAFTPFVAVDQKGHVGVIYSDFREDQKNDPTKTETNTWLAIFKETTSPTGGSTGVGLNFKKEHRLSNRSYIAQNGAQTTSGIMTNGDYSFLTASEKRFYALYTQTFNGPFSVPVEESGVMVDNNLRSQPFFSRVKGSSK